MTRLIGYEIVPEIQRDSLGGGVIAWDPWTQCGDRRETLFAGDRSFKETGLPLDHDRFGGASPAHRHREVRRQHRYGSGIRRPLAPPLTAPRPLDRNVALGHHQDLMVFRGGVGDFARTGMFLPDAEAGQSCRSCSSIHRTSSDFATVETITTRPAHES